MKFVLKNIVLVFTCICPLLGISQVSNIGELYISPNTKMSVVEKLNNAAAGDIINDGQLTVYNDFNNDGLVTFTPNTSGITKIKGGAGAQNITGSIPIDFNNLEFDNSSLSPEFIVSNQINVFGNSNFIKGVIKNDDFSLFVFEEEATFSNANDESYVAGFVEKKGKSAFAFPIGTSGNYVYSSIDASTKISNSYSSKFFLENSNTIAPHSNIGQGIEFIDDKQYWIIDKDANTEDVFLTFSMNPNTTSPNVNTAPYENIHIVGWDDFQKSWVDLGGSYNDGTMEVSTTTKALGLCKIFTFARYSLIDQYAIVPDQLMSPNGDGKNDFFYIEGIENTPENTVEFFNRWGAEIYSKNGYDNDPNTSFKGISNGKGTVLASKGLPEGVVFYVITYKDKDGQKKYIKNYLYIKRD